MHDNNIMYSETTLFARALSRNTLKSTFFSYIKYSLKYHTSYAMLDNVSIMEFYLNKSIWVAWKVHRVFFVSCAHCRDFVIFFFHHRNVFIKFNSLYWVFRSKINFCPTKNLFSWPSINRSIIFESLCALSKKATGKVSAKVKLVNLSTYSILILEYS